MLQPWITTLLAVERSKSFSAAAEHVHLSKVSVMKQINALEEYIGVPLTVRTPQGIALTEAGETFVRHARKIVALTEMAIAETRKKGERTLQTICVGASMMRPAGSLVELWDSLGGEKSALQFDIVPFSDGKHSLEEMLKALGDSIDCFVTPCSSRDLFLNYSFFPIKTCRCQVAMSKKHPLAKKKIITWNDLEGETLMLVRRGASFVLDDLRDEIACHHPYIQIRDFDGYYDISAFNLCDREGYIMETLDLWRDLHPSLISIPVDWEYEMPYGIIYPKEPSPSMKQLLKDLGQSPN